jgi:protein-S-isoprenylcysteine O-methyltransferase Ste14
MSRSAIFFLLVIAPALAIVMVLLGVETIPTNPLGWFLFLMGIAYSAGVVIVYWVRRERFWEARAGGTMVQEETGDRSYWLIVAGMLATFYIPPFEYLFFAGILPRTDWIKTTGVILVILGVILFVWARRVMRAFYSGHVSVLKGQRLVQSGPYHVIRHPAYAGYLLMAIGVGIGYSSIAGQAAILFLLLPGLMYRMNMEEKLLLAQFGDEYRDYLRRTKRLIPGVW